MKTVKLTPRGYCHGVVNAISKINKIKDNKELFPIYILGKVVHNKMIVEAFNSDGIITIDDTLKTRMDLLDSIDKGTIVFTAHGVGPSVYRKALRKKLKIIDTTCDDVFKSQDIIKEYTNKNYDIIFIGKKTHPEVESVLDINKDVHIVETLNDIETLDIANDKIVLTNQTTMSFYDIFKISELLKNKYPNLLILDEVCNSTKIRQEAVKNMDNDIDLLYVVGDKLSNNSNKLRDVAISEANTKSILIETLDDIDINDLLSINKVAITSGASTPTKITQEVYEFLSKFDKDDKTTHTVKSKITSDTLFPKK
ncbi:4-hydroxy-3-methylbut-2-enyl diphosphate reductase [Candidatus Izimaplasma bacterium ZiA1]|uniref:4-hydroxy-3-methylbut-2-enyl diphosphate reductase n=1 Tax=Candidatus Izimoplasma sp. ZiA1 TaxID=2024899 RepID=UPI000BAA916F|nr:4-hydroxy-3-methylbut-2-enyl diphosphate reductase [Candidatus Izimaplasma bacterium ZiA1]